eukprot:4767201-Pyramimonas_sp.AAC.1
MAASRRNRLTRQRPQSSSAATSSRRRCDGLFTGGWTGFDFAQSLRMLLTGDASQVRRESRKLLHIWWRRAARTQMDRILAVIQCPSAVAHVIAVVDACRGRGAWPAMRRTSRPRSSWSRLMTRK